jgi:hypothetical protein
MSFLGSAPMTLYRDANEFSNDLKTRLGNREDWKGCLSEFIHQYAEREFQSSFTRLNGLIPPSAAREFSLDNLQHGLAEFYACYQRWASCVQRSALLLPIEPDKDPIYMAWNRSDEEFLRRLRETIVKSGLDWLRQQVNGYGWGFFRIRNPRP